MVLDVIVGYVRGLKGDTGETGATGATGEAATISVGTVSTAAYGQQAQVTNVGTSGAAVFDFVIPEGRPGEVLADMSNLTNNTITTSTSEFPVPAVGDTGATLWGKVVKFFSDIRTAVNAKIDSSKITTSLGVTATGSVADATVSKVLNDKINGLIKTREITATTSVIGAVALIGLNPGNSTPLIVYDIANNTYRIRRGTSEWVVIVTDPADNDRVTNTEVNMYVRYIDKTN